MDLIKHDPDFIPNLCGLQNTGVLCYLNTMLQSLMSCSAFNSVILKQKDQYIEDGNKVALEYIRLLEKTGISVSHTSLNKSSFKITVENGSPILKELVGVRRRRNSNLTHGRQEDFHEGLTFLIEHIGGRVEDLFSIRYKLQIQCRNKDCKKPLKDGPVAPPNFMFHLFEEDPVLQDSLNSKESIEQYIKRHVNIPEDYICESCKIENKKVNGSVQRNVIQIYSLARLSEIVILVFNKYENKKVKFFPQTLDFMGKNGNLHYEIAAQVEHMGGQHGGHYLVKCRRPRPAELDDFLKNNTVNTILKKIESLEKRKDVWETRLDEEKKKPATRNNTSNRDRIQTRLDGTINQIKELKKRLREAEKQEDNKSNEAVFQINDSYVGIDPNGFIPTRNTYVVVYTLR